MKKLLFFTGFLCLFLNKLPGQIIDPTETGDPPRLISAQQRVENFWSEFDTSEITTGILYDQTFHLESWEALDGRKLSDTLDIYRFQDIYLELRSATIGNKQLLPPFDSLISWKNKYVKAGLIPLAGIYYEYEKVKPNAVEDQLIDTFGNKAYFNPDAAVSPLVKDTLFLIFPLVDGPSSPDTESDFILPEELYFSNITDDPDFLVDFHNGQGTHSLELDEKVNTSLAGDIFMEIMETSAQKSLRSAGKFKKSTFTPPDRIIKLKTDIPYQPECYQGKYPSPYALGRAYLLYGKGPEELDKPFIIVEGIDFPSTENIWIKDLQSHVRYGNYGWDKLMDPGIPEGYEQTALSDKFINALANDYGYDILFLDFQSGADYVDKNAMLVVKLIEWVNQNKTGDKENVVSGISMGGICTRIALNYMEENNIPHCTRLWGSWDSPHEGAHILLGLQYLTDFFGRNTKKQNTRRSLNAINSPAAQQLLIYHYNPSAHCERAALKKILGDKYPRYLRKVAVTNGSTEGTFQPYLPTAQIIRIERRIAGIFRVIGNVWAMPGKDGKTIFHGKVPVAPWKGLHAEVKINSSNGWKDYVNLDVAPGATQDFPKDAVEPYAGKKWAAANFPYVGYQPTASTLGIYKNTLMSNDNYFFSAINSYLKSSKLPKRTIYPFDAYYSPKIINEIHSEFTLGDAKIIDLTSPHDGNIEWVINQLLINEYPLPSQLPYNNHFYYNYGTMLHQSLHTLTIIDEGVLGIMNEETLGFPGTSTEFPNNLDFPFPLHTSCGAAVTINDGGKMIIGGYTSGNEATLDVMNESTLQLNEGSELTVNNGSSLIIHPNSKLIYNGGKIILNGPNAKLIIRGQVDILENRVFSFSGGPAGSGEIRLECDHCLPSDWKSKNFNFSPGSSIDLRGTGKNDVVLVIDQETFYVTSECSSFSFRDGRILMGKGARLHLGSPVFMRDFYVTRKDPLQSYRGISFAGDPDNVFSGRNGSDKSIIEGAETGIDAWLTWKGGKLLVSNTIFRNCTKGILAHGKNVWLRGCEFSNNFTGFEGSYLQHYSEIYNTVFNENEADGLVTYGNDYSLGIEASLFRENFNSGIWFTGGILRLYCNQIIDNGFFGLTSDNAFSFLSNDKMKGSGYNAFSGNFAEPLHFTCHSGLNKSQPYLNNGYNSILKTFTASAEVAGEIILPGTTLKMQKNYWGAGTPSTKVFQCLTGNFIPCDFSNPASTVAGCPSSFPGWKWEGNEGGNSNLIFLNTPSFENVRLDQAIQEAVSLASNDSTSEGMKKSLGMFREILTSPEEPSGGSQKDLLVEAYKQMQNVFNKLPVEKKSRDLYQILRTQKHLENIASEYDLNSESEELTFDLISSFRSVGEFDSALSLCMELSSRVNPDVLPEIEKLSCVISFEKSLSEGIILPEDAFLYYNCEDVVQDQSFLPFDITGYDQVSETFGKILFYPNPSSGNITLLVDEEEKDLIIEVFNARGKEVPIEVDKNPGSTSTIRVHLIEPFSSGIYWVRITGNTLEKIEKLLIIK